MAEVGNGVKVINGFNILSGNEEGLRKETVLDSADRDKE